MIDPVIVIGPPRSGTSAVARVLHEDMGVCMGLDFRPPNEHNPEGSYEDHRFIFTNQQFLLGEITFKKWWSTVNNFFLEINSNGKWGFKDSRINYLIGLLLINFEDPLIIRCRRDVKPATESMTKAMGINIGEARCTYYNMNLCLDRITRGRDIINIDLTNKLTDEQIKETILAHTGHMEEL